MNYKQQGSAHVVVIVVVVFALLGALGFIFWQNFLNKDAAETVSTTPTATTNEEKTASVDGEYNGAGYTFSYPTEGWKLVEVEDYQGNKSPSIQSDNYEPSVGQGIDAGAIVNVYVSDMTPGDTIDKSINELKKYSYIGDVKKITVSGEPAYSMRSGYEGWRNTTIVLHDGKDYSIIYQYDDEDDEATYKEAYDMIVSTFKLD